MGLTKSEIFTDKQNKLAAMMKALAHPARIAIIQHLLKANACINGDLVALPPGAITDPRAVLGMSAAYRISAGQPIKAASLRSAQAVVRGATVRIDARGKGFVVSSEGEALDNAAPGATVQVRTAGGQVVSGIVKNAGLVEIQL